MSSAAGERKVLDLRGKRGMVDVALAEEILAPIAEGDTSFGHIILSTRSISPEAADVFARELSKLSRLQVADLSDIVSGIPEQLAFESIRKLAAALADKDIEELDLSDNALGWKGVKAAEVLLRQRPALRRVRLCNDGLSAEACQFLAELLLPEVGSACALEQLHFFNNMSGSGGGVAVGGMLLRCPQLRDFRLASTRCGSEGGAAICKGLAATPLLQRLDLSDNTFGPAAGAALGAAVASCAHLRALNLSDLGLEEEGIVALAAALEGACGELEELDLSVNEAGAAGGEAIAVALQRKAKLRVLKLNENELGPRGAKSVVRALHKHAALETLALSNNGLGARACAALITCAPSMPRLATLSLNENFFPEEALENLREALPEEVTVECEDNDEDGEEEEEDDEEQQADADWAARPAEDAATASGAGGAGDEKAVDALAAAVADMEV